MTFEPQLPTIGFLSTYPPTSCGLATFTHALRTAIADERGFDDGLGVVSLVDFAESEAGPDVVYSHLNGDPASVIRTINTLNSFDVVLIQHEYGIYGGPDGSEVLQILAGLHVPSVVTLHTVLSRPSDSQRSILEKVVALADQTIVMSDTASQRLIENYDVDPAKITTVPHGARISLSGPSLADGHRPVFLTWGLIGPGKGLETAIDAFAGLKDVDPLPRYIILGKTHPKVQAASGDAYLNGLQARVEELGLEDVVEFDGRYLDIDALTIEVRSADFVVLPYESTEQVTSGVLVEAIGAGKPVIASAFPHAVEMLRGGAGIVVPHSDPDALSAALRKVVEDPELAEEMSDKAREIGATLYWPVIARVYQEITNSLVVQQLEHHNGLARVG
ncbi:MAG TPA: glycosyltransferase [Acidimicrobiia bacterium]|nr:glycosyltransferase [Acidimicrobiia bacterium]